MLHKILCSPPSIAVFLKSLNLLKLTLFYLRVYRMRPEYELPDAIAFITTSAEVL